MAKKQLAKAKTKAATGKLKEGLTWRLSDPGMGLLERAGLAALSMSLRAADEQGKRDELAPLTWNDEDLTPESVTIRSTADDKSALTKLFEWAWQVKDGVLYLPAVHRDSADRDNYYRRLASHNGILCTFLQHPNTQPRMDWESRIVRLDEDREIDVSFQVPADRVDDTDRPVNPKTNRPHQKKVPTSRLRLLSDVDKLTDRKGQLSEKDVSLSNWVYPGISGRYGSEGSWENSAPLTLLIMLSPIACLYSRMHRERNTWSVIVPDVSNLTAFDTVRSSPLIASDPKTVDVASLSDAALRFLSVIQSQSPRRALKTGCRVIAMGKVGYYQSQSIRKSIVDITVTERTLKRYRILQACIGNRWLRRRQETAMKKKEPTPKATGYYSVPSVRGRITDNFITKIPWYADLAIPLRWDLDDLERIRKRRGGGTSIEAIWFENLTYQRGSLMELIQDDEMWDDPRERDFVVAFWETLGALYSREYRAVERGGSRSPQDRIEDLNEEIRRSLTRAKTGAILRQSLAELLARPVKTFRSKQVREHPALIWQLIDDDWKRGRDLALLALASYQRKDKRSSGDETQDAESDES